MLMQWLNKWLADKRTGYGLIAVAVVVLYSVSAIYFPVPSGASSINTGGGGITGGTCTNQFVRSLNTAGVPVCNTVANTDLASPSITVSGTTCTLGSSCSPSGSGTSPNIATITRPNPASFVWVNQGSGTLSTTGGGLNISAAGASGTNVRAQVATPGGGSWNCNMNVAVQSATGNPRAGVLMRESGTGKLLSLAGGGGGTTAILFDRWASDTSFTGTQGSYTVTLPVFSNGFWVRTTYDGTNAKFLMSPDGVNYVEVYTELKTASFTVAPDQCGIFFDSEGTGQPPQSVTLLSYSN